MPQSAAVLDDFFKTLELMRYEIHLTITEDDDSEKNLVYTCGVLDMATEDASENSEGMRTMMGVVESDSGHRFHALLDIMVPDSGEHWKTQLVVPGPRFKEVSVIEQGTPQFDAWMLSAEANLDGFKMAPYRYRYYDESKRERDHHVDSETGWSLF